MNYDLARAQAKPATAFRGNQLSRGVRCGYEYREVPGLGRLTRGCPCDQNTANSTLKLIGKGSHAKYVTRYLNEKSSFSDNGDLAAQYNVLS